MRILDKWAPPSLPLPPIKAKPSQRRCRNHFQARHDINISAISGGQWGVRLIEKHRWIRPAPDTQAGWEIPLSVRCQLSPGRQGSQRPQAAAGGRGGGRWGWGRARRRVGVGWGRGGRRGFSSSPNFLRVLAREWGRGRSLLSPFSLLEKVSPPPSDSDSDVQPAVPKPEPCSSQRHLGIG